MSDSPLAIFERYLDLTTQRYSVVTTNLANVDTPGFHARDIDFGSELRRAIDGNPAFTAAAAAVSREVPGLLERPDGNNVDIDQQSLLLAETQMQYRIGVQLARNEFHKLMTAINEGKQS